MQQALILYHFLLLFKNIYYALLLVQEILVLFYK